MVISTLALTCLLFGVAAFRANINRRSEGMNSATMDPVVRFYPDTMQSSSGQHKAFWHGTPGQTGSNYGHHSTYRHTKTRTLGQSGSYYGHHSTYRHGNTVQTQRHGGRIGFE